MIGDSASERILLVNFGVELVTQGNAEVHRCRAIVVRELPRNPAFRMDMGILLDGAPRDLAIDGEIVEWDEDKLETSHEKPEARVWGILWETWKTAPMEPVERPTNAVAFWLTILLVSGSLISDQLRHRLGGVVDQIPWTAREVLNGRRVDIDHQIGRR